MPAATPPIHIAAIDIGSNAIRLVLGEMNDHHDITVMKKVREPVRLGKDVFADGEISKKTAERAVETFKKFQNVLKEANVRHVRAVATSALRETRNREWFVSYVQAEAGIKIEVIDGMEEARLIHSAVSSRIDLSDQNALLIDIGGGSVELTVSAKGQIKGIQTFKLGTVRLLQMLEERGLKEKHLKNLLVELMAPVKTFVQSIKKTTPIDLCVGTGGNFECLGKMRVALLNKNSIFSMTYHELSQLIEHLASMSVKERIQFLRLRPDRADVVVPAALVVHAIMGFIPVEMLSIPYVGLRDGILADLGAKV